MRVFETRHGQVLSKEYYKNDPSLPLKNVGLSDLGKEQARLLAKRLKELNFKGVIFSSPYNRTMMTASIVAEELNVEIIPLPCLREIVSRVEDDMCDATAEELVRKYPRAKITEEFFYPWWGDAVEGLSDVIERVKKGLEFLLSKLPKGADVLLVGHAATSVALRHLFGVTERNFGFHWNCHLSLLYSSSEGKYTNDCAHLPEKMRTGNALLYTEQKRRLEENKKAVRSLLNGDSGKSVLHIGDTHSANYGYYQGLIEEIKPDVIIHTGDLADELKAGRIEAVRPYWRAAASSIVKIMEKSGARVIIVAGNNDLEEELRTFVGTAEIMPRNTVLELYGKKVLLCHELNRMDESVMADVYLYGHGLTGETRAPKDNARNGKLYFNAVWGASLHVFEKEVNIVVPHVYI